MSSIIETKQLCKTYKMGDVLIPAVKDVNLIVNAGEILAIMGSSGSGKSSLMNLLGCLDQPTTGEYFLDGISVGKMNRNERAAIRNHKIGFVFQGFNLLARTSALENAMLPLIYDRSAKVNDPEQAAREALQRVGLGDRMDHHPHQLSGGQQQRVAIARALVNKPSIILADEPTGNLDTLTSLEIMALFQDLNKQGITAILVTHEPDIARYATRIVLMRDGCVVNDVPVYSRRMAANDVAEYMANKKPDSHEDAILMSVFANAGAQQ
ncbi:MAG: ABC transporter ATP-binding protein [Candidatus Zixiibacteriota bacterium]